MNRFNKRWLALGLGALWQGTALAAESPPAPSAATDDARNTDEGRRAVERARKALEDRRQWIDGLTLESVTASQWPNSSLGCPRPGLSYLQVISSGYTVRFTGKDAHREVHVAGNRAVVCGALGIRPRIAQ